MTAASMPPTTRATMPYEKYIMPSFLWSTVTIQSCSACTIGREVSRSVEITIGGSMGWASAISFSGLVQTHEVRHERIYIVFVQLHCRHQTARLDRIRRVHP